MKMAVWDHGGEVAITVRHWMANRQNVDNWARFLATVADLDLSLNIESITITGGGELLFETIKEISHPDCS